MGWFARLGRVPLGYLGDAAKTGEDVPGHRRRALLGSRATERDCAKMERSSSTVAIR